MTQGTIVRPQYILASLRPEDIPALAKLAAFDSRPLLHAAVQMLDGGLRCELANYGLIELGTHDGQRRIDTLIRVTPELSEVVHLAVAAVSVVSARHLEELAGLIKSQAHL